MYIQWIFIIIIRWQIALKTLWYFVQIFIDKKNYLCYIRATKGNKQKGKQAGKENWHDRISYCLCCRARQHRGSEKRRGQHLLQQLRGVHGDLDGYQGSVKSTSPFRPGGHEGRNIAAIYCAAMFVVFILF